MRNILKSPIARNLKREKSNGDILNLITINTPLPQFVKSCVNVIFPGKVKISLFSLEYVKNNNQKILAIVKRSPPSVQVSIISLRGKNL